MSKRMYHPCHKLSVPSAKIFWCRHCMQMFEDAISRWKHSKICRYNSGVKQKDQDGQVIQMYVKPDTVSYTQNLIPGQTVIHKPLIKKKTAELKCVICDTKFYSLYDMREHVRYPCQRSSYNSVEPDSSENEGDVREESVSFKIRRVELENDLSGNSNTALSVLAEASKHVESLSHEELFRNTEKVEHRAGNFPTITSVGHVVEVAPLYPNYNPAHQVTEEYLIAGTETIRPAPRRDLEPISIVIQSEDGQDLPESSLSEESIINYLKEAVQSFQVGQILQVQIKAKSIQYFIVGPGGSVLPADPASFPIEFRTESEQSTESTSTTSATSSFASTSTSATAEAEAQIISDSSAESSLLLALALEQNSVGFVPKQVESGTQPEVNTIPQQVKYYTTSEEVETQDILSQSVKQEILTTNNTNFITETEHSYQLPFTPGSDQNQSQVIITSQPAQPSRLASENPAQTQQIDQGHQVDLDSASTKENFNPIDLQQLVSLVQQSVAENQYPTLETRGSVVPVYTGPNQNSQQTVTNVLGVGVPVVIEDKPDSEVVQAGDILSNLVYTYAASENVNNMAQEQQQQQQLLTSAVDLFGFAELTGDFDQSACSNSSESAGTPVTTSTYGSKPVGTHRIDENEVVVPIFSVKSGITKYKVLARQIAEDDFPETTNKTFCDKNVGRAVAEQRKAKNETVKVFENKKTISKINDKIIVKKMKVAEKTHDGKEGKVAEQRKAKNERVNVFENKKTISQINDKIVVKKMKVVKTHEGKDGKGIKIRKTETGSETKKPLHVQEKKPLIVGKKYCNSAEVPTTRLVNKKKSDKVQVTQVSDGNQSIVENDTGNKLKTVPKTKQICDNKGEKQIKGNKKKKLTSIKDKTETDVANTSVIQNAKLKAPDQVEELNTKNSGKMQENITRPDEKQEEMGAITEQESRPIEKQEEIGAITGKGLVKDSIGATETELTIACDSENISIENDSVNKGKEPVKERCVTETNDAGINSTKAALEEKSVKCVLENKVSAINITETTCVEKADDPQCNNCVLSVNECCVALKRDPSIDNLYTNTADTSESSSTGNGMKRKLSDSSCVNESGKQPLSRHSIDSVSSLTDSPWQVSVKRQKSAEEKMRLNMVYNADIDVRKSGRLKSAKCASRYRGDYGIRSDTYCKITARKPLNSEVVSDTENEQLARNMLEDDELKSDSVDGSVTMQTVSENDSVIEVIDPNTTEPVPNNVIHRKVKKLKHDILDSSKHIDKVEIITCDLQDSSQLVSVRNLDTSMEVDNEVVVMNISSSVDEKVSEEKIWCIADTSSCDPCSSSDMLERSFQPSLNSSISSCDTSGILDNNSLVPCQSDTNCSCKCDVDKQNKSHETSDDSAQMNEVFLTSQDTENYNQMHKQSESDEVPGPTSVSSKSGYVHSVGKSVYKKQKYMAKKPVKFTDVSETCSFVTSPELSPEKCDPIHVLETLRLKMFEKVGLRAQDDDKPKTFESKLISSKLKQSKLNSSSIDETVNQQSEVNSVLLDASVTHQKTPPRCSTPSSTSSSCVSILEEVAKTLNSMQKSKRKNETKLMKPKPKRRRFEEKKFMLRSMSKIVDDVDKSDKTDTEEVISGKGDGDALIIVNEINIIKDTDPVHSDDETCKSLNKIEETKKDRKGKNISVKHKRDSDGKSSHRHETNLNDDVKDTVDKTKKLPELKVVKKNPKPVKCNSCHQTFRSKELMRKHYPCRVRQTRTWSQNKLRPNRAFRNDTLQRRRQADIRAKLAKSKKENNKPRPQLLTPRKTKFRRVKGKRRRKLYQLIQFLINKRKVKKWPHLSVKFTELTFKEQHLYRLGLFCVGNKSEGIGNYSGEDFALFKEHQEKEKEFYLNKNFKHIFPSSDEESADTTSKPDRTKPEADVCDTTLVPDGTDTNTTSNGNQTDSQSQLDTTNDTCDSDLKTPQTDINTSHLSYGDSEESNCDMDNVKTVMKHTETQEIEETFNKLNVSNAEPLFANEIIETIISSVFERISGVDQNKRVCFSQEDNSPKVKSCKEDFPTPGSISMDVRCPITDNVTETCVTIDGENPHIPDYEHSGLSTDTGQDQDISSVNQINSKTCLNNIPVPTVEILSSLDSDNEVEEKRETPPRSDQQSLVDSVSSTDEFCSRQCNFHAVGSLHPKTLKELANSVCNSCGISVKCDSTLPPDSDTIKNDFSKETNNEVLRKDFDQSAETLVRERDTCDSNTSAIVDEIVGEDEMVNRLANYDSKPEKSSSIRDVCSTESDTVEDVCVDNVHTHLQNTTVMSRNLELTEENENMHILSNQSTEIPCSNLDHPTQDSMEEGSELSVDKIIERFYQKSLEIESVIRESYNRKFEHINKQDELVENVEKETGIASPLSDATGLKKETNIVAKPIVSVTKDYIVQLNEIVSLVESDLESDLRNLPHNETGLNDAIMPTKNDKTMSTKSSKPEVGNFDRSEDSQYEVVIDGNKISSFGMDTSTAVLKQGCLETCDADDIEPPKSTEHMIDTPEIKDYVNSSGRKRDGEKENQNETNEGKMHKTSIQMENCDVERDIHVQGDNIKNISSTQTISEGQENEDSEKEVYDEGDIFGIESDEPLTANDLFGSESDSSGTDQYKEGNEFTEEHEVDSGQSIQKCSSPRRDEHEIKEPAVIKYKINGLFIKENLETGIKEIIAEDSCETDIQFCNTSQDTEQSKLEDVEDTSVDPVKSSDVSSETSDVEINMESDVSTPDSISAAEILEIKSAEVEDMPREESLQSIELSAHSADMKESPSNDFVTLELDDTKLQDNITCDKNDCNNVTMSEKENVKHFANLKEEKQDYRHKDDKHSPTLSRVGYEEKEVMRQSDEKDCLTASLSDCEHIQPCDQSLSDDLRGPFKVLEKEMDISFIHKPETPPVLEKVVGDMIEVKVDEISSSEDSQRSGGGPPVLEPAKKPRNERHFLDVIGEICENKVDAVEDVHTVKQTASNIEDKDGPQDDSPESVNDTELKEDIGRHFSDVIDSSKPEHQSFSEMQFLLDKSERGEVTLSQIKSLFKPESKKGSPIPKDRLLKIRTGVEHIVSKVKLPEKKDPIWLKRNPLFNYSYDVEEEKHNMAISAEENWSSEDSELLAETVINPKLSNSDNNNKIPNENDPTSGNISNNILQMLTSLEDKGSFADNMNNLLDILAENLGFQKSSSATSLEGSDENVEEEKPQESRLFPYYGNDGFIDDELDEPPPLDEIPIADDSFEYGEPSPKQTTEDISQEDMDNQPVISEFSIGSSPVHSTGSAEINTPFEDGEHFDKDIESKAVEASTDHINLNTGDNQSDIPLHPSQSTSKAHTIFKSITELNSIETDDDSDSREAFDVVTMSQRMSELKCLNTEGVPSDVDSDVFSDRESLVDDARSSENKLEVPTLCDSPSDTVRTLGNDEYQAVSEEIGISKLKEITSGPQEFCEDYSNEEAIKVTDICVSDSKDGVETTGNSDAFVVEDTDANTETFDEAAASSGVQNLTRNSSVDFITELNDTDEPEQKDDKNRSADKNIEESTLNSIKKEDETTSNSIGTVDKSPITSMDSVHETLINNCSFIEDNTGSALNECDIEDSDKVRAPFDNLIKESNKSESYITDDEVRQGEMIETATTEIQNLKDDANTSSLEQSNQDSKIELEETIPSDNQVFEDSPGVDRSEHNLSSRVQNFKPDDEVSLEGRGFCESHDEKSAIVSGRDNSADSDLIVILSKSGSLSEEHKCVEEDHIIDKPHIEIKDCINEDIEKDHENEEIEDDKGDNISHKEIPDILLRDEAVDQLELSGNLDIDNKCDSYKHAKTTKDHVNEEINKNQKSKEIEDDKGGDISNEEIPDILHRDETVDQLELSGYIDMDNKGDSCRNEETIKDHENEEIENNQKNKEKEDDKGGMTSNKEIPDILHKDEAVDQLESSGYIDMDSKGDSCRNSETTKDHENEEIENHQENKEKSDVKGDDISHKDIPDILHRDEAVDQLEPSGYIDMDNKGDSCSELHPSLGEIQNDILLEVEKHSNESVKYGTSEETKDLSDTVVVEDYSSQINAKKAIDFGHDKETDIEYVSFQMDSKVNTTVTSQDNQNNAIRYFHADEVVKCDDDLSSIVPGIKTKIGNIGNAALILENQEQYQELRVNECSSELKSKESNIALIGEQHLIAKGNQKETIQHDNNCDSNMLAGMELLNKLQESTENDLVLKDETAYISTVLDEETISGKCDCRIEGDISKIENTQKINESSSTFEKVQTSTENSRKTDITDKTGENMYIDDSDGSNKTDKIKPENDDDIEEIEEVTHQDDVNADRIVDESENINHFTNMTESVIGVDQTDLYKSKTNYAVPENDTTSDDDQSEMLEAASISSPKSNDSEILADKSYDCDSEYYNALVNDTKDMETKNTEENNEDETSQESEILPHFGNKGFFADENDEPPHLDKIPVDEGVLDNPNLVDSQTEMPPIENERNVLTMSVLHTDVMDGSKEKMSSDSCAEPDINTMETCETATDPTGQHDVSLPENSDSENELDLEEPLGKDRDGQTNSDNVSDDLPESQVQEDMDDPVSIQKAIKFTETSTDKNEESRVLEHLQKTDILTNDNKNTKEDRSSCYSHSSDNDTALLQKENKYKEANVENVNDTAYNTNKPSERYCETGNGEDFAGILSMENNTLSNKDKLIDTTSEAGNIVNFQSEDVSISDMNNICNGKNMNGDNKDFLTDEDSNHTVQYGNEDIKDTDLTRDSGGTQNFDNSFVDPIHFQDEFCETIAEKVKRKQKERLIKMDQARNRNRSFLSEPQLPKVKRKEISIFRSTMLEKKAERVRQKSLTSEIRYEKMPENRERSTSLPKDMFKNPALDILEKVDEAHVKTIINVKPCMVKLKRLSEKTLEKYKRRDIHQEDKPPIRFKISLTNLCVKPCSPRPNTSDAASGNESPLEESESEVSNESSDEYSGSQSVRSTESDNWMQSSENRVYRIMNSPRAFHRGLEEGKPIKIRVKTVTESVTDKVTEASNNTNQRSLFSAFNDVINQNDEISFKNNIEEVLGNHEKDIAKPKWVKDLLLSESDQTDNESDNDEMNVSTDETIQSKDCPNVEANTEDAFDIDNELEDSCSKVHNISFSLPSVDKESVSQANVDEESDSQSNAEGESVIQPNIVKKIISEPNVEKKCVSQPNVEEESVSQLNVDKESLIQPNVEKKRFSQQSVDIESVSQANVDEESVRQANVDVESDSQSNVEEESVCQPNIDEESVSQSNVEEQSVSQGSVDNKSVCQPNGDEQCVSQPNGNEESVCQTNANEQSVGQPIVDEKSVSELIVNEESVGHQTVGEESVNQPNVDKESVSQPNADDKSVNQPNVEEESVSQPAVNEESVSQPNIDQERVSQPIGDEESVSQSNADKKSVSQPNVDNENGCQTNVAEEMVIQPNVDNESVGQPNLDEESVSQPIVDEELVIKPIESDHTEDFGDAEEIDRTRIEPDERDTEAIHITASDVGRHVEKDNDVSDTSQGRSHLAYDEDKEHNPVCESADVNQLGNISEDGTNPQNPKSKSVSIELKDSCEQDRHNNSENVIKTENGNTNGQDEIRDCESVPDEDGARDEVDGSDDPTEKGMIQSVVVDIHANGVSQNDERIGIDSCSEVKKLFDSDNKIPGNTHTPDCLNKEQGLTNDTPDYKDEVHLKDTNKEDHQSEAFDKSDVQNSEINAEYDQLEKESTAFHFKKDIIDHIADEEYTTSGIEDKGDYKPEDNQQKSVDMTGNIGKETIENDDPKTPDAEISIQLANITVTNTEDKNILSNENNECDDELSNLDHSPSGDKPDSDKTVSVLIEDQVEMLHESIESKTGELDNDENMKKQDTEYDNEYTKEDYNKLDDEPCSAEHDKQGDTNNLLTNENTVMEHTNDSIDDDNSCVKDNSSDEKEDVESNHIKEDVNKSEKHAVCVENPSSDNKSDNASIKAVDHQTSDTSNDLSLENEQLVSVSPDVSNQSRFDSLEEPSEPSVNDAECVTTSNNEYGANDNVSDKTDGSNSDETEELPKDDNRKKAVVHTLVAQDPDYVIYETQEESDNQFIRLEQSIPEVSDNISSEESNLCEDVVMGLETETFGTKTILQETITDGDEIIYYAVEVNEDFDETNETISNLEQINEVSLEPESINICEADELETNFVESMAVEGYEITENDECEEVEIGEADGIVGHEEIIPVNEVEACTSEMTDISCVAIIEKRDRFLYGINEDSQSSQELVEECVMDCTAEVELDQDQNK